MCILELTTNKNGRFSESKATKSLEKFLFYGSGDQFLGTTGSEWQVLADGTEKLIKAPCPQIWRFSTEHAPGWWQKSKFRTKSRLDYIKPLWLHLCGAIRGLAIDDQTTHVPFLAVDLDRHWGIPAEQFIKTVRQAIEICNTKFANLKVSTEVNKENGSSKLFLWSKTGQPLLITTAQRLAAELHQAILEQTGQNVEVFPHNCKQLRLPLHPEKSTIIDSGVLKTTTRRKGINKEPFQAHSVVEFVKWLKSGGNFDQKTFLMELIKACKKLPDEPSQSENKNWNRLSQSKTDKKKQPSGSGLAKLRDEPNSQVRQHQALMIGCRRATRVLDLDEALDFIKNNGLYSGSWHDNESGRRSRVDGILRFIAKTFNPALCGSGTGFLIDAKKYLEWVKKEFPAGIVSVNKKSWLTELGEVRSYTRYINCTQEDVACWLAINEFCRETCEYGDGGVPEERASAIWQLLYEDGQVSRPWDVKRWRLIRERLVSRGIINCDYVAEKGKAYCYSEGKWYPGKERPRLPKCATPGHWRDLERKERGEGLNSEGVVNIPRFQAVGCQFPERAPP